MAIMGGQINIEIFSQGTKKIVLVAELALWGGFLGVGGGSWLAFWVRKRGAETGLARQSLPPSLLLTYS